MKKNFITIIQKAMTKKNLKFNKENDNCWYIDLPNWPFAHHNLMMVAGADNLCEMLSDGNGHTSVEVIISDDKEDLPDYIELEKTNSSLTGGADYDVHSDEFSKFANRNTLWLCPVTLFVFMHYPNYIYVKKI
jgi:hypothetical protein